MNAIVNTIDADIVIAGTGIVGLTAALLAARMSRKVILLNTAPPSRASTDRTAHDSTTHDSHPLDPRVYAIGHKGHRLLQDIGVWQKIPAQRQQIVHRMCILSDQATSPQTSSQAHAAHLTLEDDSIATTGLAWIIESAQIEQPLREGLSWLPNVQQLTGSITHIQQIATTSQHITLTIRQSDAHQTTKTTQITAKLLIAADGKHSPIRHQLGISTQHHHYGHSGVVAHWVIDRPHHGTAWQRFGAEGSALAWLPMADWQGQAVVSMVWSCPHTHALSLMQDASDALKTKVQTMMNCDAAPQLQQLIQPPALFPLQWLQAEQLIHPRVMLMGDAAHAVHPLAGQGLNLGLEDIAAWHTLIQAAQHHADDLTHWDDGASWLLAQWQRERLPALRTMRYLTDGLHHLFKHPAPPIQHLRRFGLELLQRLPFIKQHIIRQMTA
jgi:2-octaprenylphenol hydroxylase